MTDKILIFTPGHNVSKTIEKVFDNLREIKKLEFDTIYVDNCSSDNSIEIVKKSKLRRLKIIKNKINIGYGGSQKVAFDYAFRNKYDILIEYDGDLQYPHKAIYKLYDKLTKSNSSITFGSRVTSKKNIKQMPLWKQLGNKLLNNINNWGFNFKVSEIHTGFRAYNLNLIKGVNLKECHNDYRWTLDSVLEIMKINKNFSEISIDCYYHQNASAPSFKELWRVTSYMVLRAFKYRILKR